MTGPRTETASRAQPVVAHGRRLRHVTSRYRTIAAIAAIAAVRHADSRDSVVVRPVQTVNGVRRIRHSVAGASGVKPRPGVFIVESQPQPCGTGAVITVTEATTVPAIPATRRSRSR